MATGTLTGFPINWSDVLASFGIGGLATPNVWSSTNKFTGTIAAAATGTTSVEISTSATGLPIIRMTYAAAAADQKLWEWYTTSSQLVLRTINDAGGVTSGVIAIDRSGVTPTLMTVTPSLAVLGGATVTGAITNANTSGVRIGTSGAFGAMQMAHGASATDSKVWDQYAGSSILVFRMLNDAFSAQQEWMRVTRSAMVVSDIALGATSVSVSGTLNVNSAPQAGVNLRSQSASVASYYTVGRTGAEAYFGVSGGVSNLTTGDVAGDSTVRANQKLWMSIGAVGHASMDATNGVQFFTPASFNSAMRYAPFTLSTLPSAAAFNGYCIEVSNATGGPRICRSNGSVWQILNTSTTVS